MFAGFGIGSSEYLDINRLYTFTFEAGKSALGVRYWQPSEQNVMEGLSARFQDGSILSVNRDFGSGRYAISAILSTRNTLSYLIDEFLAIFADMGLTAEFVTVDAGPKSSQPGGAGQVASDTATKTVQVVGGIAKDVAGQASSILLGPLLPIIIIGGGLMLGYAYMQNRGMSWKR